MLTEPTIEKLKALKLHAMITAWIAHKREPRFFEEFAVAHTDGTYILARMLFSPRGVAGRRMRADVRATCRGRRACCWHRVRLRSTDSAR